MEPINHVPQCPDPQCDAVATLLATAALGGNLSADEQAQTLAYVATCARCRLRLDGFAGVAQVLPLLVPEVEPPPALRERILGAATQRQPRSRPVARPRRTWRPAVLGAFAVVALVLALLVGQQLRLQQTQAQIAQQQQQTARNRAVVIAAFGNADSREARLVPSGRVPEASGRVLVSASAPAVVVYAKQLPPSAPGRVYQVWLEGGGVVRNVGTFEPDANQRAWALLGPQSTLPDPEAVFITEEPLPGSPQPSGREVLRARFP